MDRIDVLVSPGMVTNFEALGRSYDYVVVDAGAATGREIERIAEIAPHAVLVTDAMTRAAIVSTRERLSANGFGEVTMLAAAQGGCGEAAAAA
jgi:MinD-like ATPase involved in chromosome partitioning or flagellar assembly